MSIQAEIVTPPKHQPRFVERWAYWIIGCVVIVGFVNARWPEFFSSLLIRVPYDPNIPVPVDRQDIKFTSSSLETAFNQIEQEMIRRSGKKKWQFKCQHSIIDMMVTHNKHVLPGSRTTLSLLCFSTNPLTVNEIYSSSESNLFELYVSVGDVGARGHKQAQLQVGITQKQASLPMERDHLSELILPTYFLSTPIVYQNSEYNAQIDRTSPLPPKFFEDIFNTPETFLEAILAQEDAILTSARKASESNNLIFNGFNGSSAPVSLVIPLSLETIDEIHQVAFDKLQQRRKYLIEHHREMYELLVITPLSKESIEVYGAYLDGK